ncbi:hypothetical protein DWB77_00702 [Streptomyces hundungensis]|uniref:HTH arsR-type domain-containing protein n=2 Tax=Streptomyces hundungensis TaxID=1077946 RepID=A0A387H5D5_9ACTN|nr:hypothetical protein DWB77_00702 [Streptomyces hundungensis]
MFLDPLSHGFEDGLETVLSTPATRVRSELGRLCPDRRPLTPWIRRLADGEREPWRALAGAMRQAYAAVLADQWPLVQSAFHAERAWRTRMLAEHGIRATLACLGPGGRCEGTTLIYDCPTQTQAHLVGHGIILLPSVLWQGRPLLAVHDDGPSILFYAATTPLPLLGSPADIDAYGALTGLLGRTRAAIVHLLVRQCTTSEVARELGISKSSASEHTKALRAARLIFTHREGKTAWHSCTPLGLDLVTGATAALQTPRRH